MSASPEIAREADQHPRHERVAFAPPRTIAQSTQGATLADLLERILDKGIVIAGDIRVKLVEVELLTIQIRLVICSVDKAKEMGMDWWVNNPMFSAGPRLALDGERLDRIERRLAGLEAGTGEGPRG